MMLNKICVEVDEFMLDGCDTLFKYLATRNGSCKKGKVKKFMSKAEGAYLGVDITKSGWANIDKVVTKTQVCSAWKAFKLKKKRVNTKQMVDIRIEKRLLGISESEQKFLYLMSNNVGLHKIGISKDPVSRANTLQLASGNLVKLVGIWRVVDAYEEETNLHRIYSSKQVIGEWFDLSREDVESLPTHLKRKSQALDVSLISCDNYLERYEKYLEMWKTK